MGAAFTVDTLQLSKRLREAGLKKETAEVLAEEFKEIGQQSVAGLATKEDIKDAREDIRIIRKDMQVLEHKIGEQIKSNTLFIIVTLGGFITVALAVAKILFN